MSHSRSFEGAAWIKGERTGWTPRAKLLLAFVLGLLALSPAILGIYWEWFLPR